MKNIKDKIFLIFFLPFFPISIYRFYLAIHRGWNSYTGELFANFPFYILLPHYNPILHQRLTDSGQIWFTDSWFYGPVHHFWLFPATFFFQSIDIFFHTLLIFYACLIIFVAFQLYKAIKENTGPVFFIAYFTIFLGSFQLLDNLQMRNVELLEFSLIIFAYLCLRKNRDYAAGSLLCFAAMAKLFPFIFLPYLLIKKDLSVSSVFLLPLFY